MDFSFSVFPLECKVSVQLSTIHFKFPLWAISLLEEKDVHLMGPHCSIHPLKVKKVHANEHLFHSSSVLKEFHLSGYEVWWKFTNVLEEATSSVSTIKMEEPTTSKFMVRKKGTINFYHSTWCQNRRQLSLQTLL